MVILTEAIIREGSREGDAASSATTLNLAGRNLDEVSAVGACLKLVRLDLSNNHLSTIQALSSCLCLKWLSVAGNGLKSLKGIESLSQLSVLNGSRNALLSMDEVVGLVELRALILNDNQIKDPCLLSNLVNLNALVLSRNPISDLRKVLKRSSSLTKLSLSSCKIQSLGSALKWCSALKELRLAHNQMMTLSKDLGHNKQLQILDLGSNLLQKISDIEVLGTLQNLRNLNLRGNPLSNHRSYQKKVTQLVPWAQVLDGHPVKSSVDVKKQASRKKEFPDSKADILRKSEETFLSMPVDKIYIERTTFDKHVEMSDKKGFENFKVEKKPQQILDVYKQPSSNLTGRDIEQMSKQRSKRQKIDSGHCKDRMQTGSGVLSVREGNKSSRSRHKKNPNFFKYLAEVSIGSGGPSSWGEKPDL